MYRAIFNALSNFFSFFTTTKSNQTEKVCTLFFFYQGGGLLQWGTPPPCTSFQVQIENVKLKIFNWSLLHK